MDLAGKFIIGKRRISGRPRSLTIWSRENSKGGMSKDLQEKLIARVTTILDFLAGPGTMGLEPAQMEGKDCGRMEYT